MKRNRLATVLRLREIAERRRRGELAQAELEVRQAQAELEKRSNPPVPMQPSEVLSPVQMRALAMQGVASHELLMAAAEEATRTYELQVEAHEQWSLASREQRSAQRLDERRRNQSAEHARIAAERALDEMVVLRRGWAT